MEERQLESHPSYGMLGFFRTHSGTPKTLFGSSIKHSNTIRICLKAAEKSRRLNSDWYYGRETLFEAEMSYAQFAELISSINVGDGVPVTIKKIAGKEKIPLNNQMNRTVSEAKGEIESFYQNRMSSFTQFGG